MSEIENTSTEAQDGEMPQEFTEEVDPAYAFESNKPRNSAMMVLLMLVVIGGGLIFLMRMKAGPKSAMASPEVAQAKQTINEFLNDGGKNLIAMRALLANTEKVVQQFLNYPSTTQVKLEDLKTNPFRATKPETKKPDADPMLELAKKMEAEKTAVLKTVQALQLQSVLRGAASTCMINNQALTEGQAIEGFTVEKITANSVIVKRDSALGKKVYRFELKMTR